MSPEAQAPTNSTETATISYEDAVKRQQTEALVLSGGETFDQSRVDAVIGHTAVAEVAPAIEVTQAGADLLADLTTDPSEPDSEAAINEAARRQLDLDSLAQKRQIDDLAMKNSWTEDKYQEELQKIGIK
ncbi:MAG: hypothetical protein V4611_02830 [Patescibacteria group bacterium]